MPSGIPAAVRVYSLFGGIRDGQDEKRTTQITQMRLRRRFAHRICCSSLAFPPGAGRAALLSHGGAVLHSPLRGSLSQTLRHSQAVACSPHRPSASLKCSRSFCLLTASGSYPCINVREAFLIRCCCGGREAGGFASIFSRVCDSNERPPGSGRERERRQKMR